MDLASDVKLWGQALRHFQNCEAWQRDLTNQGFEPLVHPSDLDAMQGLCTFALGFLKYESGSGRPSLLREDEDDGFAALETPALSSKEEAARSALDYFARVCMERLPLPPSLALCFVF